MSSSTLYRASGLALLLGALLFIIGNILGTVLFPGNSTATQLSSALYVSVSLVSFIGELLLLLGLSGIVVRQAQRAGWLGFVGFVLTFLGGALLTSTSVVSFLVFPWLAQVAPKLATGNGPPAFFVYFLVAGILFALGGILLGIATMGAQVLPRWAGLLLIIGAVISVVDIPLSGTIGSIVGLVAFVLFAVAVGWMGYALLSEGPVEAVQPATASS
jgi:hypothetical protein